MGRFIKRDNAGRVYLRDSQTSEWILVSNQSTVDTKVQKRNKQRTSNDSLFKLVTVRKLEGLSVETVTSRLRLSQSNLEKSAILAKFPIPAPVKFPETNEDLVNYFSVYIDEDLRGRNEPIYTFFSDSYQTQIRAYVSANSANREGWSVHLAYVKSVKDKQDGLKEVNWTLITIDNRDIAPDGGTTPITERQVYQLDLDAVGLPDCFKSNFSLENLKYLGGGIWACMIIDPEDRIPIEGVAPASDERYKKISTVSGVNFTVVSYSVTPTYSYTWCRGQSVLRYRWRRYSVSNDDKLLEDTGVIVNNRISDYNLELVLRPRQSALLTEKNITEFCNSDATYVGNTNYTLFSPRQSPDYGTDQARFSLQKYSQQSNVIRPNAYGVLAASKEGANLLRLDMGTAEGKINHPYEIKSSVGKRGVSYEWQYKYWWAYGQILDVYPLTKNQYTFFVDRATGLERKSTLFVEGSAPYGELFKTLPNQVITTWDAPPNPETGYFPIRRGEFSFVLRYSMPPLFSHEGCYYYQVNPERIGSSSSSGDRFYDNTVAPSAPSFSLAPSFSSPDSINPNNRQNAYIAIYTQILGVLGGSSVSSFNIGYRPIAASDTESILVRSPNPEQRLRLSQEPSLFPNSFYL
jgi:hypothetical protein